MRRLLLVVPSCPILVVFLVLNEWFDPSMLEGRILPLIEECPEKSRLARIRPLKEWRDESIPCRIFPNKGRPDPDARLFAVLGFRLPLPSLTKYFSTVMSYAKESYRPDPGSFSIIEMLRAIKMNRRKTSGWIGQRGGRKNKFESC